MARPNRYDTMQNFVPASPPKEREYNTALVQVSPHSVIPVDAVWKPVESKQTSDSVSAKDRAMASLADSIPVHFGLLMLSFLAAGVFWRVGNTETVDAIFVFFGVMGLLTVLYNKDRMRKWFDHSHAGVERLRINKAAETAQQWKREEEATKREALRLQLKLLEGDRYDE